MRFHYLDWGVKGRPPIIFLHGGGVTYGIGHAAQLGGLGLVDIGPEISLDGSKRIRDFISQDRVLDSVDAFVERAMAFNPRRNPTLLRRSLLHNLRKLPDGKFTWKHDPNRMGMSPDFVKERVERAAQIQRDIHRISCPTLIMRGERSDVFTDANAAKFAESLPQGRWIKVENAGHTIQGDNPAGLLNALNPFMREIGF